MDHLRGGAAIKLDFNIFFQIVQKFSLWWSFLCIKNLLKIVSLTLPAHVGVGVVNLTPPLPHVVFQITQKA